MNAIAKSHFVYFSEILRDDSKLKTKKEEIEESKEMTSKNTVTFVYAAHDEKHNSAVVLKEYIERG